MTSDTPATESLHIFEHAIRIMEQKVKITKMVGGGVSWYYAVETATGKILGASHEDDKEGMKKLHSIQGKAG